MWVQGYQKQYWYWETVPSWFRYPVQKISKPAVVIFGPGLFRKGLSAANQNPGFCMLWLCWFEAAPFDRSSLRLTSASIHERCRCGRSSTPGEEAPRVGGLSGWDELTRFRVIWTQPHPQHFISASPLPAAQQREAEVENLQDFRRKSSFPQVSRSSRLALCSPSTQYTFLISYLHQEQPWQEVQIIVFTRPTFRRAFWRSGWLFPLERAERHVIIANVTWWKITSSQSPRPGDNCCSPLLLQQAKQEWQGSHLCRQDSGTPPSMARWWSNTPKRHGASRVCTPRNGTCPSRLLGLTLLL